MTRSLLAVAALLMGCASSSQATKDPAADVSLRVTDMEGSPHDLDAALERGETVALVFWQTWCTSCAAEAPALAKAAADHGATIRFVGVVPGAAETVDDEEVRETRAAWGYTGFPQVRDVDMSLTRGLGVKGTPTVVVLGKGREVRYRAHRSPSDWASFRGPPVSRAQDAGECEDGVCPLPPTR